MPSPVERVERRPQPVKFKVIDPHELQLQHANDEQRMPSSSQVHDESRTQPTVSLPSSMYHSSPGSSTVQYLPPFQPQSTQYNFFPIYSSTTLWCTFWKLSARSLHLCVSSEQFCPIHSNQLSIPSDRSTFGSLKPARSTFGSLGATVQSCHSWATGVMDSVVTSHRLTGHPHSIQSSVILITESITTNLVNSRNHGSCRTHIIMQGLCALFTNVTGYGKTDHSR